MHYLIELMHKPKIQWTLTDELVITVVSISVVIVCGMLYAVSAVLWNEWNHRR